VPLRTTLGRPSTSRGIRCGRLHYLIPSLFVIVVLADLAARMSLTKLALACSAADELWVLAAETIAFRSDSARVAPAVSVLKTAARFDGGFSVSSWLRWFCQRVASCWKAVAI
jgi:hypothetical protein